MAARRTEAANEGRHPRERLPPGRARPVPGRPVRRGGPARLPGRRAGDDARARRARPDPPRRLAGGPGRRRRGPDPRRRGRARAGDPDRLSELDPRLRRASPRRRRLAAGDRADQARHRLHGRGRGAGRADHAGVHPPDLAAGLRDPRRVGELRGDAGRDGRVRGQLLPPDRAGRAGSPDRDGRPDRQPAPRDLRAPGGDRAAERGGDPRDRPPHRRAALARDPRRTSTTRRCVRALREVGYDWYWIFEVSGPAIEASRPAWERAAGRRLNGRVEGG